MRQGVVEAGRLPSPPQQDAELSAAVGLPAGDGQARGGVAAAV